MFVFCSVYKTKLKVTTIRVIDELMIGLFFISPLDDKTIYITVDIINYFFIRKTWNGGVW